MSARFGPLAAALLVLACGVPEPPGATGGVDAGGAGEPCPRGIAVASSDYQSTNVSLLGTDGSVLSSSFISSASAATGLSSPLTGDVVLPTARSAGADLVLIDRFPASVLTWVDLSSGAVRAQLGVGTGFAANPHDYVPVDEQRAFVTRYETNPDPGRQPLDRGGDLLLIDPSRPALVSRVDLAGALDRDASEYLPRADRAVRVGARVYVLLSAYSADFSRSADSRLVALDAVSGAVVDVLVLAGLHGCGALAVAPGGDELGVSCTGDFAGDSAADLTTAGLVRVALAPGLREVTRFHALDLGEDNPGFSLSYVDATHVALVTFGAFAPDGSPERGDVLLEVELTSGAARDVLHSEREPFTLGDVRCEPACGACFATDAGRGVVHRFDSAGGTLGERREIVVDTAIGLPPRYLGAY